MTGKPVFAPSEREKVLFPDPASPVTMTRRPIKAASLIEQSVSLKCCIRRINRSQATACAAQWHKAGARNLGLGERPGMYLEGSSPSKGLPAEPFPRGSVSAPPLVR